MSRAILLLPLAALALALAVCVVGCFGNSVVDCSYGSDTWVQWQAEQFTNKPGAATFACLVAKNTGQNIYPTDAVPPVVDAGAPDPCVPCIASQCKEALLACYSADAGTRCEALQPAYTALAICIAANCATQCPGVP